jgi:hypothetical protein
MQGDYFTRAKLAPWSTLVSAQIQKGRGLTEDRRWFLTWPFLPSILVFLILPFLPFLCLEDTPHS